MKRRFFIWAVLVAAVSMLVSCDGWGDGGSSNGKKQYKFPSDCMGGMAVWWMAKESCIDEEPYEKVNHVEGASETKVQAVYRCHLDLSASGGFSNIQDYFLSIRDADYSDDPYNASSSPEQWASGETPLVAHFLLQEDEHMVSGSPMYDTVYRIFVSGDDKDGHPVLEIEYMYTHFERK